jgi:pimeloyl-ACP methyl ester carboxylesterase
VQRRLATSGRVIALDQRNHGRSPHAPGMDYDTLAADALETLQSENALPCALIGHSMGGKTAMRMALNAPEAVERLLVADIAPVPYQAGFRGYAEAMAAIDLSGEVSRSRIDAALAPHVPDPSVRAFLLLNFSPGPPPMWRNGLDEIAAGLPDIQSWPPTSAQYIGPTLFVAGARSDYIRPEHRTPIRALFPKARFISLRNAGHWLHADDPAGFLGIVEAFLQPSV